jgi:hypothetical protein
MKARPAAKAEKLIDKNDIIPGSGVPPPVYVTLQHKIRL